MVVPGKAEVPGEIRRDIMSEPVKALVLLPLWDELDLLGFVACEDTRHREWRPTEIVLLGNIATAMAAILRRERLQLVKAQRDSSYLGVLDQLENGVYIADLATDQLLWSNQAMKALFPHTPMDYGLPCYTALHGRETRCPHCRLDRESLARSLKEQVWENRLENPPGNFTVSSRLTRWHTGRPARLNYIMNM